MAKLRFPFILPLLPLLALAACTSGSPTQALPVIPPGAGTGIGFFTAGGDVLAVVGEAIRIDPVVTGAVSPEFALAPGQSLPIGLSLDPLTGAVSGLAAYSQPRTEYDIVASDALGRQAKASIFIQVNPDIYVTDLSAPTVASTSGPAADLSALVSGGKGGYVFQLSDPTMGTVTSSGLFTPSSRAGKASIVVTDNGGAGSFVALAITVGVPSLSVSYASPAEGAPLVVRLSLTGSTSAPSVFSWQVSLGSLAMASNLAPQVGSGTIAANNTSASIVIPTYNNHIYKDSGSFTLSLAIDQNVRFAGSQLNIQQFPFIVANVNPQPFVTFSAPSSAFVEADGSAFLTINLVGQDGLPAASTKPVSVDYALAWSVPQAPGYDNFAPGTLAFAPAAASGGTLALGETTKTVSFELFHDALSPRPSRAMMFTLGNASGATLVSQPPYTFSSEVVTITDPIVATLAPSGGDILDFVLSDWLATNGWNGLQSVIVRIAPGATLRSSSAARAAFSSGYLSLSPAAQTTVTVQNRGTIVGHGGAGGGSQPDQAACNAQFSGQAGGNGGPGISTVVALAVVNSGTIMGGGGGGGGGVSSVIGTALDGSCSGNARNITWGGAGGVGADLGVGYPFSQFGPGLAAFVAPAAQAPPSPSASAGGNGGAPGLAGSPGAIPAAAIAGQAPAPGAGGSPGPALLGTDSAGNPLVSIQNAGECRSPWDGATIRLAAGQGQAWCGQAHALAFNAASGNCYVDGANLLYQGAPQAACAIPAASQSAQGLFIGAWAQVGVALGE